uniref:Clc-like protein n=1 Tax=Syphacia muris TaxID=451379 RepID=A0A0N5A7Q3_9BILA
MSCYNDDSVTLTAPFIAGQSASVIRKKSTGLRAAQKICLGFLMPLTLSGFTLSLIALYLPSWQVVYFTEYMHDHGREHSMHEHGLWQDCNRNVRKESSGYGEYETIMGPSQCIYKWDYENTVGVVYSYESGVDGETHRHHFYGWQIATLIFLGIALVSALVSMLLTCCGCLRRSVAFSLTATCLLTFTSISTEVVPEVTECSKLKLMLFMVTVALSAIGTVVFFFYSHRAENRFISSAVLTHEQVVGTAFYLQLAATSTHLFAFVISLVLLMTALKERSIKCAPVVGDEQEMLSVSQMSKSTGPNILRTLEVDPPLLYQQTTGTTLSHSTSHYIKNPNITNTSFLNNNIYRSPAASMPELPSRIYRCASETCV